VGNPVSLDIATGLLQTLACTGKDQTGQTGTTQFYAGCDSNGQPISWTSLEQVPQGVSGQVGPFASATEALNATKCVALPPTPPTPGTGGMCCDPATGAVKLPSCIMIDLCDWSAFTNATYAALCKWSQDDGCFYEPVWRAIKKGLCEFINDPKCRCAADDADRSMWEDCTGDFGKIISGYMGQAGSPLMVGTLDEVVDAAMSASGLGGGG
jgi:hypothetical protein